MPTLDDLGVGHPDHHRCPGGCGDMVPNRLLACPSDWTRLPIEIRREVLDTARMRITTPRRTAALVAAKRWYLDNPRPRKPSTT